MKYERYVLRELGFEIGLVLQHPHKSRSSACRRVVLETLTVFCSVNNNLLLSVFLARGLSIADLLSACDLLPLRLWMDSPIQKCCCSGCTR